MTHRPAPGQLPLPGLESTDWELLNRKPPPELVAHLRDRRRLGHDSGGVARLMRKLVRAGLPEEDLLPACALILELDRQAAER